MYKCGFEKVRCVAFTGPDMRQTGFPPFRFDWLFLLNVYFVLVRVGARLRFESAACKHWRDTVNSRNLDGFPPPPPPTKKKKCGKEE